MSPDLATTEAVAAEPIAADMPPVVFDVRDLDVYYGQFRAVRDVNLEILQHEITAFIRSKQRSTVDFPQPDGPMNAVISCWRISRFTSRTARNWP